MIIKTQQIEANVCEIIHFEGILTLEELKKQYIARVISIYRGRRPFFWLKKYAIGPDRIIISGMKNRNSPIIGTNVDYQIAIGLRISYDYLNDILAEMIKAKRRLADIVKYENDMKITEHKL